MVESSNPVFFLTQEQPGATSRLRTLKHPFAVYHAYLLEAPRQDELSQRDEIAAATYGFPSIAQPVAPRHEEIQRTHTSATSMSVPRGKRCSAPSCPIKWRRFAIAWHGMCSEDRQRSDEPAVGGTLGRGLFGICLFDRLLHPGRRK